MLSVLVMTHAAARRRPVSHGAVVRSLSSLVSAVIDGVVRDVILLASDREADFETVADHAGCDLVTGASPAEALQRAAAGARCPFVFIVEAGVVFERGLIDELQRLGPGLPDQPPGFAYALQAMPGRLIERLVPRIAPTRGLLVSRERLRSHARDMKGLRRGSRPLLRLSTTVQAGEVR